MKPSIYNSGHNQDQKFIGRASLKSHEVSRKAIVYIIKGGLSVRLSVCMHPSSAYSFGQISMKLGVCTPWDPGSDMG